jgi:DeoR family transcriptional regulator of aga operon
MGAAANHEDEAKVNRQMVQRSKKVVVIADSSKFTHTAFATICSADQINTIITDSGTDEKMLEELRQLGIEIIIA